MKQNILKIILTISFVITFSNIGATHLRFKYSVRAKDSLLNVLQGESNELKKIQIYRNLADLNFRDNLEVKYLEALYEAASKTKDSHSVLESLYDLSIYYIEHDSLEKAEYYKNLIGKHASGKELERLDTYLSMRLFNSSILKESGKNALQQKLDLYTKDADNKNNSVYKKIERAYVVATALYDKKDGTATPYAQEAVQLTNDLPLSEGIDYIILTKRLLARIYAIEQKPTKSIQLIEEVIKAKEDYVIKNCVHRPFYPMFSFYIINYSTLMTNIKYLTPRQADEYISIIFELYENSFEPADRYSCLLSMYNYYLVNNQLKKALSTNDSLIQYAKTIAPYNLASLYNTSAIIYNYLQMHKEAFNALKTSNRIKDSISNKEFNDKLSMLQVEYDVNKLNYEKSQLEVRNKQIVIIALIVILLLSSAICVYLYTNLKKERLMKVRLKLLNEKADESEKLKTAFINSICHEIRTPLNAIAGFSELITDATFEIDKDTQKQFSLEISTNTKLLTTLIDVIIEVSNLDVSGELLECEPIDIAQICHNHMSKFISYGRDNIDYRVDIVPESIIIPTHARYFGLVIENLLSNADKFTEQGNITIACKIVDSKAIITVTDTGCGIPESQHEYVFERFTKLDIYAQGSGLGLYLCQLVVKRLAGRIYIDPTYTNGTRVVVELPIQ